MPGDLIPTQSDSAAARSRALASARKYINASRADNTKLAYEKAWRDFATFCSGRHLTALPASPGTVAEYLTWLADNGRRPSTIQVKLSAISFIHAKGGMPNPAHDEMVKSLISGIRRSIGTAPQQKAAILLDELEHMVGELPRDLRGIRDKAILLLGYAGAFRRSEIVALDVENIRFTSREMIVTLPHSKTDQESQGAKKRIPMLQEHPADCPVRAVRAWMRAAHISSGPVFRAVDQWDHVRNRRMSDRSIAIIVKHAAEMAGMEPRQFAGHSLRAGFVTQAAKEETPEWQIQEVTGHKSAAMMRKYIRDAGTGQIKAIKRVFGEADS
jgi:integrase